MLSLRGDHPIQSHACAPRSIMTHDSLSNSVSCPNSTCVVLTNPAFSYTSITANQLRPLVGKVRRTECALCVWWKLKKVVVEHCQPSHLLASTMDIAHSQHTSLTARATEPAEYNEPRPIGTSTIYITVIESTLILFCSSIRINPPYPRPWSRS